MKYVFHVSPNLQSRNSTQNIMRDLTIGLGVVFVCSLIYYATSYGMNYALQVVLLLLCSLVTAFVCETVFAKVKKQDIKSFISHSFAWVTCLIMVMMCTIDTPVYAVIVATFFAVAVGRLMFGGFGNNIYNPAAVGRAVIFASFSGMASNLVTSATPTGVLASTFRWLPGSADALNSFLDAYGGWGSLFLGTYPGAMGETFTLAIVLVGIFLIVRHVIDWRVPVMYLGTIFVIAALIAVFSGIDAWNGIPAILWYPCLHLLVGGVVFGAFFMLTDPVTMPVVPAGRVFFAICAGIITMLIRMKGNFVEGCLYSILIMNTFTPLIEQMFDRPQLTQIKKGWIVCLCSVLAAVGVAFYAAQTIRPVRAAKDLTTAEVAEIKTEEETL